MQCFLVVIPVDLTVHTQRLWRRVPTAMGGLPGTRLSLFLVHFCLGWPVEAGRPSDHVSSLMPRDETDISRELQIGLRDCILIEKCEMCTFSDQKNIVACQETGRREKRVCTAFDGDGRCTVRMFMMYSPSTPEPHLSNCSFPMIK